MCKIKFQFQSYRQIKVPTLCDIQIMLRNYILLMELVHQSIGEWDEFEFSSNDHLNTNTYII